MSQMVQVKLLCDRVVGFGTVQYEGQVVDVTADEATRMVKAGQAEAVTTRTVETAMLDRSGAAAPTTTRTTKRSLSKAKG